MSVPVRTTPQSETARAKEEMNEEAKRILAERKQLHLIAAKISEMNWGKGLSAQMQNAVAAYCRESLLDAGEINVLGGNVYRNANYYLRRLSEMLDDGEVEYAKPDHVHADPRLAAVAKGDGEQAAWARTELDRRTRERIALNIPDAAVAAVIFRVKLRGIDVEFAGAKWCGGGTRKSDPVGDSFPVETAETRACRRCMRYIASQIPRLKWREDELDERGAQVSARIVDEREAVKLQHQAHARQIGPGAPIPTRVFHSRPTEQVAETVDTPAGEPAAERSAPDAASDEDEDLLLDQQLLADEAREKSPPGSNRHDVPKPGAVQDAFKLGDEQRPPNRNAQID